MLLFLILSMVIHYFCQKYWLNQKMPSTFSVLTSQGIILLYVDIFLKKYGLLIDVVILMGLAVWLSKKPGYGVLIITVIYLVGPRISALYGVTNGFNIAPSVSMLGIATIYTIILIVLIYEFVKYRRTDHFAKVSKTD